MFFRTRWAGVAVVATTLLAAPAVSQTPVGAGAPKAAGHGFRLFARAMAAVTINRVYCGLDASGEICVDSSGSSTIGGGFWPKHSTQNYIFNSGIQVAGVIDSSGGWSWAGDTTGAFFFDPKGTTKHGAAVEPYWNFSNAGDRANWPEAAKVPAGDPSAALFDPSLQGKASASEGDLWSLAWDGDTALNAGRPHPLGVAMETRVLAWNYPGGNRDIIYFLHTFYNISSTCAADYTGVRPELRAELLQLAQRFQAMSNAKFGVQIPDCGYTIGELYFGSLSDNDVSSSGGSNYASVNLPLKLRYTYQAFFRSPDYDYLLPSELSDPPFLNGYGFVGTQFLRTPMSGPGEVGIKFYSNFTGGGAFGDPGSTQSLFRVLTGTLSAALGDGNCNYSPVLDHICYVKSDGPADMRDISSTGPATLPPGGSTTIAVAYLFASAVAITDCPVPNCPTVLPGDPRFLSDAPHLLASGANDIDSLAGFTGYVDDNADGVVQGNEFRTVRNSLYQKAQLAQTIFDHHFLLPQAPAAPEFFLVPGDDRVTVVWRPSAAEQTGDPYFTIAGDPASGGYDPNYRRFDVEGYRIYRGRVDDPSHLTLLAQFDYGDHDANGHPLGMRDFLGTVNSRRNCAPELGHTTTADGCQVDFQTPPPPGVAYTVSTVWPLVGPVVQVRRGDRFFRATGELFTAVADTAVTGGGSGSPDLVDTGVPFAFVDSTVRNSFRYFYTVVAFDVNSIESGPSSLESARVTKPITPTAPSPTHVTNATFTLGVQGRGGVLDPSAPPPILDSVTGEFSGPMPPADATSIQVVGPLVSAVLNGSGSVRVRLDSLRLGQADLSSCCTFGGPEVATHYFLTLRGADGTSQLDLPIVTDLADEQTVSHPFTGIGVDSRYEARYGGSGDYTLLTALEARTLPIGYVGGSGVAAGLGLSGFQSYDFSSHGTTGYRYDGYRWYSGTNESMADPTSAGMCGSGTAACVATSLPNYNNAGEVRVGGTPIGLVYMPHSYRNVNREWRNVEAVLAGAVRAADIRVYWGNGGVVDSVIDLTHDVPLSWDQHRLGAGWAILNTANTGAGSQDGRDGVLTPADWLCVEPFFSELPDAQGAYPCTIHRNLSKVAQLGAIAVGVGDNQSTSNPGSWRNTSNNAGNGFAMYVAGTITFFGGMSALPAAGERWTLRTYSGVVLGGKGGAPGALGPYTFVGQHRPFTAVGARVVLNYTVTQTERATTRADLAQVHTVPDPYYVTNGFETDPAHKVIKFVNLPTRAIVRIYTASGILVRVLEHASTTFQGDLDWDLRNSGGRLVANGVYFYAIEAQDARRVGRMTIVSLGR